MKRGSRFGLAVMLVIAALCVIVIALGQLSSQKPTLPSRAQPPALGTLPPRPPIVFATPTPAP